MYIHIGGDVSLLKKNIIAIFDMDNTTTSKHTIGFLNQAERDGRVTNLAADIPASFVVTDKGVYYTQIAPRTLKGIFW